MKRIYIMMLIALIVSTTGCKKDWMAEKRDLSLVIPTSLQDLRKILNDSNTFRKDHRMLASMAVDEYYISDDKWKSLSWQPSKSAYIWEPIVFDDYATEMFWGGAYKQVFYANIILEGLDKITPSLDEQEEYNDIKGTALFFRARAFYSLAVLFSEPYINEENGDSWGIPLRLSSDISAPVLRNSLKETYDQIVSDLKLAVDLLRIIPEIKINPSKPAAMGLLARCYLGMADYESAFAYADSCLKFYDTLIDFNTLDLYARFPFSLYNEEVIQDATLDPLVSVSASPNGIVDSSLYNLYEDNDLRKSVFFVKELDGTFSFRGVYHGKSGSFGGISVNEMILIRSESSARLGQIKSALADLNLLLNKRFENGKFLPIDFLDREQLLIRILLERRKELLFRGLRWEDLRRLNRESGKEVTFKRMVNGETYLLKPDDSKYVFEIPETIHIESNIE